jgi:hypothetical protein
MSKKAVVDLAIFKWIDACLAIYDKVSVSKGANLFQVDNSNMSKRFKLYQESEDTGYNMRYDVFARTYIRTNTFESSFLPVGTELEYLGAIKRIYDVPNIKGDKARIPELILLIYIESLLVTAGTISVTHLSERFGMHRTVTSNLLRRYKNKEETSKNLLYEDGYITSPEFAPAYLQGINSTQWIKDVEMVFNLN